MSVFLNFSRPAAMSSRVVTVGRISFTPTFDVIAPASVGRHRATEATSVGHEFVAGLVRLNRSRRLQAQTHRDAHEPLLDRVVRWVEEVDRVVRAVAESARERIEAALKPEKTVIVVEPDDVESADDAGETYVAPRPSKLPRREPMKALKDTLAASCELIGYDDRERPLWYRHSASGLIPVLVTPTKEG